jgi:organic radical activating enzyme
VPLPERAPRRALFRAPNEALLVGPDRALLTATGSRPTSRPWPADVGAVQRLGWLRALAVQVLLRYSLVSVVAVGKRSRASGWQDECVPRAADTSIADALHAAIDEERVGDRLWLYSNYHCNLHCVYCLTDSAPTSPRRLLAAEEMLDAADQARALGFRSLGVTGGEPFLLPEMPEILAQLAGRLPVLVLSNATLFTDRLLERMRGLADLPVTVQVSLDSAEPEVNDEFRSPHNFAKVVRAIPRLVEMGIPVRIATTGDHNTTEQLERLCALHRSLGVSDSDHVVRPVVRRGRAAENDMGVVARAADLSPELTITADGAFWSPFAPTVEGGRLDLDLLISRQRQPLAAPLSAWLALVDARPPGADTALNIR